jgi:flavin-dependent dehydrogenase
VADPLTREGIRYGLLTGRWAAESLLEGRPAAYPERLEAELREDMEKAGHARDLFFEGAVGRWTVPLSRVHPGIRRVLSDLLACRQPYTGLRRRLLGAAVGLPTSRTHTPSGP